MINWEIDEDTLWLKSGIFFIEPKTNAYQLMMMCPAFTIWVHEYKTLKDAKNMAESIKVMCIEYAKGADR